MRVEEGGRRVVTCWHDAVELARQRTSGRGAATGRVPGGVSAAMRQDYGGPEPGRSSRLDARERGVLDENPAAEFLSLFRRDVEHALDSTALRNRDLDEANGTKPGLGNLVQVRLQVDSRRWARTGPERRVGGLEGRSDAARATHHRDGRDQDGIASGDATHGAADVATIEPRRRIQRDTTSHSCVRRPSPTVTGRVTCGRGGYVRRNLRFAEMRECDHGGHTSSAAATACYLSIS